MRTKIASSILGFPLGVVLLAAFFIGSIADALNSNSIDVESGGNQYLSIPDAAQTGLDITGDLTIEAWVKVESFPVFSNESYIVSKVAELGSGENNAYALGFASSTSVSIVSRQENRVISVPSLSTDVWHHIAAVYDRGTNTAKVYVNGSLIGTSTAFANDPDNNNAPFRIGMYRGTTEEPFDGLIDDVRIWNIARTGSEIADDMNTELNGNEAGLVGYWKFNGESLEDATANNNDLTNNNGVTFSDDVPFTDEQVVTPEEQAKAIVEAVLSYEFPKNIRNAYMANLKKVGRFIASGKTGAALGQLSAFVDKVETHYAKGKITDAQRNHLVGLASTLIDALE